MGLYYPSISALARRFGGIVVQPEHRFYGESLPLGAPYSASGADLALLTPQQAVADGAALATHMRRMHNCTGTAGEPRCPVVSVGGSYPGVLSFAARLRYPAVFDASYAASAPLRFFSQEVDQYAFYDHVTRVADAASPGCADYVKRTLEATLAEGAAGDEEDIVAKLGLCEPLPAYMRGSADTLRRELHMVVMYTFASLDMGNYPPPTVTKPTGLTSACASIGERMRAGDAWGALRELLGGYAIGGANARAKRGSAAEASPSPGPATPRRATLLSRLERPARGVGVSDAARCFNLSAQLPAGRDPTISSGDWTGVGSGQDGANWDFQTCTLMVDPAGTSHASMFLPRAWSLDWLNSHCTSRFGAGTVPQPTALGDAWGLGSAQLKQLARSGVLTNVIFTNGAIDGWSVGGVSANLSDTVVSLVMPTGAHHSDLSHTGGENDTADVLATRESVAFLLRTWLGLAEATHA